MNETTMDSIGRPSLTENGSASAITTGLRRVWLASLGAVAVAAEQTRRIVQTLEQKGEELEPSVAKPLVRVREAANRAVDSAATMTRNTVDHGSDGNSRFAASHRRIGGEFKERVDNIKGRAERIVDERLAASLERLGVPTRQDFEAITRRLDELVEKER